MDTLTDAVPPDAAQAAERRLAVWVEGLRLAFEYAGLPDPCLCPS